MTFVALSINPQWNDDLVQNVSWTKFSFGEYENAQSIRNSNSNNNNNEQQHITLICNINCNDRISTTNGPRSFSADNNTQQTVPLNVSCRESEVIWYSFYLLLLISFFDAAGVNLKFYFLVDWNFYLKNNFEKMIISFNILLILGLGVNTMRIAPLLESLKNTPKRTQSSPKDRDVP